MLVKMISCRLLKIQQTFSGMISTDHFDPTLVGQAVPGLKQTSNYIQITTGPHPTTVLITCMIADAVLKSKPTLNLPLSRVPFEKKLSHTIMVMQKNMPLLAYTIAQWC